MLSLGWSVEATNWKPKQPQYLKINKNQISILAELNKTGLISKHSKVVVVAEGCDNGNFFPLLKEKLFPLDGQEKVVFSTDIRIKMAERGDLAASIAFENQAKVFWGQCNAFQGPPPILGKNYESQMLILPFRMEIIGCHVELNNYMLERLDFIQSNNGIMAIHFLADDAINYRSMTLEATQGKQQDPNGHGFEIFPTSKSTEIIREYSPLLLKKFGKQFENNLGSKEIKDRMSLSFRTDKAATMVSMFNKEQVESLVSCAGYIFLDPQSWQEPVMTQTDSGHPIKVWTVICGANSQK